MNLEYADAAAHIRDAIAAYAHALDDGRADDVAALFTDDGVAVLPRMEPVRGREAIRTAYAAMEPKVPQRHVVGNVHIARYDGGRATVLSDLVFMVKGGDAWAVRLVGRYTDRMVATDAGWLFESRELVFS